MPNKSKLPDGWEDYCPFGEVIERTCILPLKVPLKEVRSPVKILFTPQTLIDMLNDRGLTLGLIIDLTFTTKYYNPEEFTNKGIYYQKIFVEGHSVPSDEAVYQLFEIINTFQQHVNFDNNYIIGIHCTHGVNRTGYMVCRFLMDVLGWKSHEAVDAFSKARFHPIDRENYINDLHRRGKLREREMAMVPSFMPQGPMLQGPSRGGFQRGGWRGDHAGFGGGGRGGFNFGGPGPSFSRKSGDVWGMNEINFDEDEYLTSWRHGEGGRGGGGRGRGGFGRGGGGRGGMRERFQPYNTRGRGGKRGGHRETTEFTSWKEAGAMNQAVDYA
ncbi:hypothetical protein ACJMK2_006588 [Sinanodonta woodiana]|uniref:RNA/RNP complex-1-interacting phosphatase n=1 Tax=Sinanodonta woodiana TaxID=1069815 RepID=A0ABD3VU19_SINWO